MNASHSFKRGGLDSVWMLLRSIPSKPREFQSNHELRRACKANPPQTRSVKGAGHRFTFINLSNRHPSRSKSKLRITVARQFRFMTDCSPIIWVSQYQEVRVKESKNDQDARNFVPVCLTMADTSATVAFFLLLVIVFYVAPLLILLVLYTFIVGQLMPDSGNAGDSYHARAKKHAITMLLSVVISFFVCLSPYRILIFYIVVAPAEQIAAIDRDTFFAYLNFSRIMFYLHSAIDPILYNLMSSKFRNGFWNLCRMRKHADRGRGRSNVAAGARKLHVSEQEENFV